MEKHLTITKAVPTGKMIASGTYSSIIELRISESKEGVAGKVFKKGIGPPDIEQLKVDLIIEKFATITRLRHKNIVESKGVCFLPDRILPVLLMKRMTYNLQSYFKKNASAYTSLAVDKRITMLHDIADGLNFLHSLNPPFIHGHLTAENVLLDPIRENDNKLTVKIGGFDIDCYPQIPPYYHAYTSPEAQGSGTKLHPSRDVFSFGHLCLVTMLQRELDELPPAQYLDNEGKPCITHEDKRRAKFIEECRNICPKNKQLFNIIDECLKNNPERRPKTRHILLKLEGEGMYVANNVHVNSAINFNYVL